MSTSVATLGMGTWELVDRVERLHGDVTVVRRCLELSELLACAHTGMADVVLVAEGAQEFTASLIGQLGGNGVRVLVVEGHDSARLSRLGVRAVAATATGEEVARAVQRALDEPVPRMPSATDRSPSADEPAPAGGGTAAEARSTSEDHHGDAALGRPGAHGAGQARQSAGAPSEEWSGEDPSSNGGRSAAGSRRPSGPEAPDGSRKGRKRSRGQPVGEGTASAVETSAASGEEPGWEPDAGAFRSKDRAVEDAAIPRGLVAVWGPAGAPGRTVTAVNLAAEAALLGARVLLVDADTYAASVAASLGMLDEAAGLAQACRLADQGRMDDAGLRRCVTAVAVAGASVDVLTGITRHDRWPEIRGSALEIVLERARGDYDLVVVDTAACLEADEEITTDFLAPRRNAGALEAVAAADTVVAVGAADALGVPRLVKALPDLLEAAPSARVLVVMNKLRAAAAGRSAGEAVHEAWERFSPGHPVAHTLPWDAAACDDALLAGAVLAETAPRTALRGALKELAGLVGRADGEPAAAGATVRGTRLGRRMGAWLRRG